jgi:hypothetical protein
MTDATEPTPAPDGLYLYAVCRSRSRQEKDGSGADALIRVRFRDLEALVRPVPYAVPDLGDARLSEHQRVVETMMRRRTVLPAPLGLVFRGRRAVLQFIEDQYIALDEGLAFLDGAWEMRLHILGASDEPQLRDEAARLYSELRNLARAAIPLPAEEGRLLSAAFLVDRSEWILFLEQAEDVAVANGLIFDLTGPWPPYDFVNVRFEPGQAVR